MSNRKATRKQSITHEDYVRMRELSSQVPEEVLAHRELVALSEITDLARAHGRPAFAWSGGKDSLVLEVLCRQVGIERCVLVVAEPLEYPAFMRWVYARKTPGLCIWDTGQDLAWLRANEHMLFPTRGEVSQKWFGMMQHTGQDRYAVDNDIGVLFFGRRRCEGNYIGTGSGGSHVKLGVTRACPIRDWSHEEVFAFIERNGMEMPPYYEWPRGFRVGSGPWAKRRVESHEQGWTEIDQIDRSIVETAAAGGIVSAISWLETGRR